MSWRTSSGVSKLEAVIALAMAAAVGYFAAITVNQTGVRRVEESHEHSTSEEQPAEQLWTCGMHPDVILPEPGTCPICNMNLVPLELQPADDEHHHDGHDGGDADVGESGSTIRIDPAIVQQMNVRTVHVERSDLVHPIRTVGYLDYDQERMVSVTTKYSGWVEKVHINHVGERVARGAPLFEIYAPELVQTQEELLSALRFARDMADAPTDAFSRAESLVEAARTRLRYWDVSDHQIEELEASGAVFRTLTVVAPADGIVMKRMRGLEGMAVSPGMELYHLANLSSLWLSVEVFENQMQWVEEGTAAEISLSYFPGETFRGTVRYLEPELSEETRTLAVRVEVLNRDQRLRKGMFATVSLIPTAVADGLVIPSAAILRTGKRDVVIVARGDGRFSPREVTIGHTVDGATEILAGVVEHEEVVVSAQFLLDSESKLREAIQKMAADASTPRGHH